MKTVGVVIGFCAFCVGAPAEAGSYERELFRIALAQSIPPSVVLTNAQSWPVSDATTYRCFTWLRFAISSNDLATVVKTGDFMRTDDPNLDLQGVRLPDWWTVPTRKEQETIYVAVFDFSKDHSWRRVMFVRDAGSSSIVNCVACEFIRKSR